MLIEALIITTIGVFSECAFKKCTLGEENKVEQSQPVEQNKKIEQNKVAELD